MGHEDLKNLLNELESAEKDAALGGGSNFIPLDALHSATEEQRIKVALSSTFSFGCSKLAKAVAQDARKIFAILVLMRDGKAIKNLYEQGLRDKHLPLRLVTSLDSSEKLESSDGTSFSAWKKAAKLSQFVKKQWLVQAPLFDDSGKHLVLHQNCSMPFIDADLVGNGAFGTVHKCRIHQAHQRGLQV
jgi:hypothetical protein